MTSTIDTYQSPTIEVPVVFGELDHLIGIINHRKKTADQIADHRVAALMLTAGMLGSAGPHRLHVDLARVLQDRGIPSMRFDLSGIGESLAVPVPGSSLERAAREIRLAIDYLYEHYQINSVVLFGLCSGADDALFAANQDDRVVGLFSIDGCGYRTSQFFAYRLFRNYLPKLMSKRAWRDRFAGRFSPATQTPQSLQRGSDVREFPDRQTAAIQLERLAQRNVAMHFHFTGGVGDYYNHAGQFVQMFRGTAFDPLEHKALVSTTFCPESDHVAFLVEHRRALVELAAEKIEWMVSR